MRMLGKVGLAATMFALTAIIPARADAALLTLFDNEDKWTLDVQTGCQTCAVTLQVEYGDPSTRASAGQYLSSVQWSVAPPALFPDNATDIGFTSTTAGNTSDWTFILANLSGNDCNGGSTSSACGEFIFGVNDVGFNISPGATYSWTFSTTFESVVTSLTTGNIRASYNRLDGEEIKNAGQFSPGGGSFDGGDGDGGGDTVIPEPASLLLLGFGAIVGGRRARRRFAS